MKPGIRYGILAVLGLAIIAMLGVTFSGPLLYSLEKDIFPSPFHENTDALKAQQINSTTDVMPLMQDLLDYTGPIVLNVRIEDIAQARRDLELFARDHRSLNNLILKLDMNQSEIDAFSESSANQERLLRELLNSSITLDQLNTLEIQYRDQDNPTMLTSIQLQGETLRKKIRTLSEQYRQETKKVVAISERVGLDTTKTEQSVVELDRYVASLGIQNPEAQQPIDIPIRRTAQMTLLVFPDTGSYGDSVKCFGYYFSQYGYRTNSVPKKNVTLFLDDSPVARGITDDTGSYTFTIPVERITAGMHAIHAESGVTRSDDRSLTVVSSDTATTLAVSPSKKAGEISCTGTVSTGTLPVRNAPVEIVWDESRVSQARTNADGEFKATLALPNGEHTIKARFTGAGYPLRPSESIPQTIVVATPLIPAVDLRVLIYAGVLGIFCLFIGGAVYYLRRAPGRSLLRGRFAHAPVDAGPGPEIAGEAADLPLTGMESPDSGLPAPVLTLFQRYTGILGSAGLGEASHVAYADLSERVARDLQISRYRVLTPRELSRSCREQPYCGPFARLVAAYERIRYGGLRTPAAQEEFEATMQAADPLLGGDGR